MSVQITEFAEVHIGIGGRVGQIGNTPPLAYQAVSNGATSATFNAQTQSVRVQAVDTCCIDVGATPSAVAWGTPGTTMRMVAGQTEYLGVPRGSNFSLNVVSST